MKGQYFASRNFKFLLPLLIVVVVIELWRNGYAFGQWLHSVLN